MSKTISTPQFADNGCRACTFLGHRDGFDVYLCTGADVTYIARYGNEGREYASGAGFITSGEHFRDAKHWTNVVAAVVAEYTLKQALVFKSLHETNHQLNALVKQLRDTNAQLSKGIEQTERRQGALEQQNVQLRDALRAVRDTATMSLSRS